MFRLGSLKVIMSVGHDASSFKGTVKESALDAGLGRISLFKRNYVGSDSDTFAFQAKDQGTTESVVFLALLIRPIMCLQLLLQPWDQKIG